MAMSEKKTEASAAAAMAGTPTPGVKFNLADLGCYTAAEIAESAKARVLLVGPPKAGKTSALCTAPKPLLINCDGPNAAKGAANIVQQDFSVIDVSSIATWKKAVDIACKAVAAKAVESIIVDTLTLLADNVLDQLKIQGFVGFDTWNEMDLVIRGTLKRLLALDAHVFLSCHMHSTHDGGEGIIPLYPGQGKNKIAGMVDDWLLMDCVPGRKPERQFILSPQGASWKGDCRSWKRADVCEATIPALFEALGITP